MVAVARQSMSLCPIVSENIEYVFYRGILVEMRESASNLKQLKARCLQATTPYAWQFHGSRPAYKFSGRGFKRQPTLATVRQNRLCMALMFIGVGLSLK